MLIFLYGLEFAIGKHCLHQIDFYLQGLQHKLELFFVFFVLSIAHFLLSLKPGEHLLLEFIVLLAHVTKFLCNIWQVEHGLLIDQRAYSFDGLVRDVSVDALHFLLETFNRLLHLHHRHVEIPHPLFIYLLQPMLRVAIVVHLLVHLHNQTNSYK